MTQPVINLSDMMARVATRDRRAFQSLYQATAPKLLGIIVRILNRRDIAEEVLQEVFVKIWERAGDFDPAKASPITWMATIARNRALDEVRRVKPVSIEDTPEALDVADAGMDPLAGAEQSDELQRLKKCLEGLDQDRREMVLLAYYNGLSRDELAERFARPVATVKVQLHRSMAQLRTCLGT
jgi:RNA polymerase sigma-70 factor, ECF subfamily